MGNILITEEGSGFLIDWELSTVVDKSGQSKAIRKRRTVGIRSIASVQTSNKFLGDLAIHVMQYTSRHQNDTQPRG